MVEWSNGTDQTMKPGSISVIIPCYNCQSTIAETLASVAAQTLVPEEVILVDDGSTDQTWEVLHALKAGDYPDVILLSHPYRLNYGSSMARCLGFHHASGEFIAFLDADDLFAPRKLEQQLAAFRHYPEIVMCHTAVKVIGDLDQAHFFEVAFSGSPEVPYWLRSQQDYLIRNRVCISSSMVRADALKRVPFSFVGKQGVEDWLCWSLLASHGPFLFLREQLTLYRVHPASITSRLTGSSAKVKTVAFMWQTRLRGIYAGLEYKLALLARSDSFRHSLRVVGSILEDLRQILIAYHWYPGSQPNSEITIKANLFGRLFIGGSRVIRALLYRLGCVQNR
ncbi:MAG: glycosyltransferase family 2 protein [Cyanobium sp.]